MNSSIAGKLSPLGAAVAQDCVHFSLFSRTATGVEFLLFDRINDDKPSRVVSLDPVANRTYHYWHTFIPTVRSGQLYGYRVHGPNDPARGLLFDATKVLLDSVSIQSGQADWTVRVWEWIEKISKRIRFQAGNPQHG